MSRIQSRLSAIVASQVPEFLRASDDALPITSIITTTAGSNIVTVDSTFLLNSGDKIVTPAITATTYITNILSSNQIQVSVPIPVTLHLQPVNIVKPYGLSNFVKFIKAYYEFMEQDQGPQELIQDVREYADSDGTIDSLIDVFFKNYGNDIPRNIIVDKRTFIKHIRDIYKTKGTEEAYVVLFQIMFGVKPSIFYPNSVVLKASDGIWKKDYTIRITPNNVTNPFDFLYTEIQGSLSKASATVNNILEIKIQDTIIYELYLENIKGNFQLEEITAKKLKAINQPVTTIGANTIIQLIGINIVSNAPGYTANSKISIPFAITNPNFVTAISYPQNLNAIIDSVTSTGTIQNINVVTSGIYYGSSLLPIPDISVPVNLDLPSVVLSGVVTLTSNVGVFTSTTAHGLIKGNTANLQFYGNTTSAINNTVNTIVTVTILDTKRFTFKLPAHDTNVYANLVYTTPAVLSADIGVLKQSEGYWQNNKGKLSDTIYLQGPIENNQNSIYYQPYSYVVRSSINIGDWKSAVTNLIHPAGMEVFSEIFTENNLNSNSSVSVPSEVVNYLGITADYASNLFTAGMTSYSNSRLSNLSITADHVYIPLGYL